MAIDTIDITSTDAEGDNVAVTVTLKGKPDAVINALCNGLPHEALMQMQEALGAEMAKRRKASGFTPDGVV